MNCDTCGKELKNYAVRASFGDILIGESDNTTSTKYFCSDGNFPETSPCYVDKFSRFKGTVSGEVIEL